MPTHDGSLNPDPDRHPDEDIVPAQPVDDDALWMILSTYADGEATDAEVRQVENLLHTRPDLSREFTFLELTSSSIREYADVEPPPVLTNAIFAATAQQPSLSRRISRWTSRFTGLFGPYPLRLAGAALAGGFLCVVLWNRYNTIRTPVREAGADIVDNTPRPVTPHTIRPGLHVDHDTMMARETHRHPADRTSHSILPSDAPISSNGLVLAANTGSIQTISRTNRPISTNAISRTDVRQAARPKNDAAPAVQTIARSNVNMEERHMAVDNTGMPRVSKADELGPDVDTHIDKTIEDPPAAVVAVHYDEPPTTKVDAVSYKPGSISDKVRNVPPAVQSLYMRTQEAIRRQHELQQYGGYGKEAFNNIQRGEVGLSLVGGRF